MKFVAVNFFLVFCLSVGVDAGSLNLANNGLTLNGNANVQFYGQKEEVWAGLSNGKNVINDSLFNLKPTFKFFGLKAFLFFDSHNFSIPLN